MEKYEIVLIVLVVSVFNVAFQVLIKKLSINKILSVEEITVNFSSKNILFYIFNSKLKQTILYYHNYQLDDLPVDRS